MSFFAKEKTYREPIRWQKELRLAPAYLLLLIWIFFTVILLGWVVLASFSTTKEIFAHPKDAYTRKLLSAVPSLLNDAGPKASPVA